VASELGRVYGEYGFVVWCASWVEAMPGAGYPGQWAYIILQNRVRAGC